MRGFVVLLCALVYAPLVSADASNRNLLPLGERASYLGNAGITTPTSEATFYNPANLARLEHESLSASGATYLGFSALFEGGLAIGNDRADVNLSGFLSIPTAVVSTYSVGGFRLATAVLVPEAFRLSGRDKYTFGGATISQVLKFEQESLWIGASMARTVANNVHVGVSAFAARSAREQFALNSLEPAGDVVISQNSQSISLTAIDLSLIAGVTWTPSNIFTLGARIHTATVGITGSGSLYKNVLYADDQVSSNQQADVDGFDVDAPLPWDMGVGAAYRPIPTLELLADINMQLPATLVSFDSPDVGKDELEVGTAVRANLGAEWEALKEKWVRLGFVYNPSANADGPGDGNYVGVTGGFAWRSKRTTTNLGGFFMQSSFEDGDVPKTIRYYGALLGASYQL